ncbi:MAG: flippase-like domain-containing protein [Chitinophagaceae bacterium]|nr:flippase-like domain-containing protein [Chitinophagaceae bacterium]
MLRLNKNIKLILNYFIGPLLFCVLVYSIYRQLQRQPDWKLSLQQIWGSFDSGSVWTILLVMGLMLVNWGIEARKWQLAISQVQIVSFPKAFKAIFTGTTLAFFTPNRMGEYMGRILYIRKGNRIKAISLTIVCSMAQLLVTLSAGLIGLSFVKSYIISSSNISSVKSWIELSMVITAGAVLILGLLYFRLRWLTKLVQRTPRINKYVAYIRVLDNFNATILLRILSLCVLRYAVFVLQYFLFFQVFDVEINWWQTFWSISVVFLILAVVPSIALLTELGIRWKASIELVALFSTNITGILATSLAIWIINLVIPALIGSLLILGIKFFKK